MTKIKEDELRDYLLGLSEEEVLDKVKSLGRAMGELLVRREDLKANPVDRMLTQLNETLEDVLLKYGKVNMATMDIARIPLVFSRIQGEEAQLRSEILFLESTKKTVEEVTKSLEIARAVLAEKRKAGGRP